MATAASALGCDVTLHLSFAGLRGRDALSKSDPFAEVLYRVPSSKSGKWQPVLRTSVVANQHSGSWPDPVDMRYRFEERQEVIVRVWDHDSGSKHDFLGEVTLTLGNLVASPGMRSTYRVRKSGDPPGGGGKDRGFVTVVAEKNNKCGGSLELELCAHKLDSKDWGGLGRSDPYYLLQRRVGGGDWTSVFKSEWIKSNNNPRWARHAISLHTLCPAGMDEPLRVQVFDWDKGTKHDLIGEFECTVAQLVAGQRFDVKHPPTRSKYKKASYKRSGEVEVVFSRVRPSPTSRMLDFIAGGLEISLMVAVDFTASNGHPSKPTSLHFHSPNGLNAYEEAISAVGPILASYDHDGQIAAFGFGGMINQQVSHCFPLNGNPQNPEVPGVPGVLQAYMSALQSWTLSGPTYFAPLLEVVNRTVYDPEISQNAQKYSVLLILTDGEIMDMQNTVDKLVQSANLPLSVIIVGVGSADFSAMEHLDGDDARLKASTGVKSARDIVQFVPFSQCRNDGEELARRTLAEVPQQLVDFFESKNIRPNPPRQWPSDAPVASMVQDAAHLATAPPPPALSAVPVAATAPYPAPPPPSSSASLGAKGTAALVSAFAEL